MVCGTMPPRKSRFHIPGIAGIVRFPDRTATIEYNQESIHVEQQGDPELDVSELENVDHADEHRIINDLMFPVPTPTWWERRDNVEIEDILIQGDLIEDVELLKVTVRQGNRQPLGPPAQIWSDMIHVTEPTLEGNNFSIILDITDRLVKAGVVVILTVRFNREQEPFSAIRIHSVGAQFDPTPND